MVLMFHGLGDWRGMMTCCAASTGLSGHDQDVLTAAPERPRQGRGDPLIEPVLAAGDDGLARLCNIGLSAVHRPRVAVSSRRTIVTTTAAATTGSGLPRVASRLPDGIARYHVPEPLGRR